MVCGNTRLDGEPVTIETYRHKSKKWPMFSENCDDSPFNKKPGQKKKPVSNKKKGISTTIIAGGAVSLAVIAVIYLMVKKRMRR